MTTSDRAKWEARGVVYDDRTSADEPEPAPPPRRGRAAWLRGEDQMDVRWVRGARGWLSLRDPVTLERVEVPTKYAEGYRPPEGAEVAPQNWVHRAMDKLPPRPAQPVKPLRRTPPPVPDDGGPL